MPATRYLLSLLVLTACGEAREPTRAPPPPLAEPVPEVQDEPVPAAPAGTTVAWRLARAYGARSDRPRSGGLVLESATRGWIASPDGALVRFDRLRRARRTVPAHAEWEYGDAPATHEADALVVWRGPALADLVDAGDRLVAVGDAGTVLEIRDGEVRAIDAGTSANLRAAWAHGDEMWIGGAAGTVLHGRSGELVPLDATLEGDVEGIWGVSPGEIFLVGRGFLARWNGRSLEVQVEDARLSMWSVDGPASGPPLAVGSTAMRFQGGAWHEEEVALTGPAQLLDVDAASGWAVGELGTLVRRRGARWDVLQGGVGVAPTFYALDASGAAVAWATSSGSLGLPARGGWNEAELSSADLTAAITDGEALIAVGGDAILTMEPTRTRFERLPGARQLSAVAASSAGTFVVGASGFAARAREGGWARVTTEARADLSAVAADGERVIAVGADGVALTWDGARFRREATGLDANLRAVCLVDGGGYAVGDGGVVARFAEDGWRREESGTEHDLRAVVARGERVLAAGANGVVIERGADGWHLVAAHAASTITALAIWADAVWTIDVAGSLRRLTGAGWETDPLVYERGWVALVSAGERLVALAPDGVVAELGQRGE